MALSDYTPTLAWFADSLSDMDEPTGTTPSNPGSLTSPTLTGSPDSYADFDGADNISFLPATPVMEVNTGDFTLVMKVRIDSFVTSDVIWENYDGSGSGGSAHGMQVFIDSAVNRVVSLYPPPRAESFGTKSAVTTLVAGQDFIIAWRRSSGTVTMWLDVDASGGMVSHTPSSNGFTTSAITEGGDITFGSDRTGSNPFDGRIYWVLGFNAAISDTDIQLSTWDTESSLKSTWGFGGGTISISATSSTGIQHWTGPIQLVGITKTLPILLGESRMEGFSGAAGFGRQFDILLGQMNAEGFTPSIAKAVTILLGETRAQGFAPSTAIIRTYLGLLGELRALGFNVSSEPAQTANVGIGYTNFTGIAGSVTTFAPATTITASALLRETQAIGLIGQVIRVVFPSVGRAHAEGFGAQALEFIKVITGPDIGEMRAEGLAATAIIGQIRNYTISLGEVGFYALQQALTIQRTLDILVGRTNYTGIEPSLAIIRGGEVNLGPQIGVVTLEGLINATANIERTAFAAAGFVNAEGFGAAAPAGQLSVQSVLGEMYASGFVPLVSFNRYFAQLGQVYASGFAPDISYGLWRPIKRRLTTWASI